MTWADAANDKAAANRFSSAAYTAGQAAIDLGYAAEFARFAAFTVERSLTQTPNTQGADR